MRARRVAQVVSVVLLGALPFALACGPGELSDFCAQALEEHAACLPANAAEVCEARNDECRGEVRIAESCPVRFYCP
jgi:hypothetical protein